MNRPSHRRALRAIGLFATLSLASCGGGGGAGGAGGPVPTTGGLVVRMHDSPIEAAEHVYVTIESVVVFRMVDGVEVEETVSSVPGQYDLLELQHGVEAVLGDGQFEPGDYHSIRLIVSRDSKRDIRTLPADTLRNYIVVEGTAYPLVVPSGATTGIKLGKNFTITAGATTVLTLDFDVRQSVHACGRRHVYRLKPRIKVVPVESADGAETGVVSTTDGTGLPSGTVVSAQQGGVEVGSVAPDAYGSYALAGLSDGTYDLVAIAPGYAYAAESDVTVSGGAVVGTHDFALDPAEVGTVYGVVTPTSDDVTVRLLWNGFVVDAVGADPSTGDYVLTNVPAGDYTLDVVDASTSASAAPTVSVAGGTATQVDVGL